MFLSFYPDFEPARHFLPQCDLGFTRLRIPIVEGDALTQELCCSTQGGKVCKKRTGTTAGATKSPSSPDPCVVEKVWERREICLLPPSSGGSIQDHNSCSTSSLCPCCPSSSCHMAQVQQSAGSVQDHNSCSTSSLCPCCPSSSCHMAQVQ